MLIDSYLAKFKNFSQKKYTYLTKFLIPIRVLALTKIKNSQYILLRNQLFSEVSASTAMIPTPRWCLRTPMCLRSWGVCRPPSPHSLTVTLKGKRRSLFWYLNSLFLTRGTSGMWGRTTSAGNSVTLLPKLFDTKPQRGATGNSFPEYNKHKHEHVCEFTFLII